ncbi:MAG: diguanylate cyclase [Snowella sp.]|nr:diguanylate cyclase [Snowella sp.]
MLATIAVLGAWHQLAIRDQLYLEQLVEQEASAIQSKLSGELSSKIANLERIALLWKINQGMSQSKWEENTKNYINTVYGYQAIEWIDASFQIRWVVPQQGNEGLENIDLSQELRRRITFEVARTLNQTILTRNIRLLQGGQGFLAVVPLSIRDRQNEMNPPRFDGFIVGVFRFQHLFDSILNLPSGYRVQIYDRNELIYSQGPPSISTFQKSVWVRTYGADWQVKVFATSDLINEVRSPLPNIILWGGLIGAWTFALTVYFGQRSQRYNAKARQINQQLQTEIFQRQQAEAELEIELKERQQAEAELRQAKEQFELAILASHDGFWDWDFRTNEIYYSPRWKEMLGYEDQKFPNTLEAWKSVIFEEDYSKALQLVEDYNTGKIDQFLATQRFHHKNGSTVYILSRAIHLKDEQGQVIRMIGAHSDITEMIKIQEALESSKQSSQEMAEQLAVRVEELKQRNTEMMLLSEMNDFLQACLTVEEACKTITSFMRSLFPECSGSISVITNSRNRLKRLAYWGNELFSASNFHSNECWALRRGQLHWINHDHQHLTCQHIDPQQGLYESLCIPLIAQGDTLGLLYLCSRRPDRLNEMKQQLARTVAEQIGLAIANLNLRETLQHQSIRDALTGLYNRRYLEECLTKEIHRAERNSYSIGIIMLDIDHFKAFNDTLGHDAGDFVLKEIGLLLANMIRSSDTACRYGGEEMTLILPEADLEDTAKKAEELRTAIAQLRLNYNGQILQRLTASLGVACFPSQGTTGIAVLQAADAALYRAKAAGRNQVMLALN